MTRDITAILNEWPFQPGQISARVVEGEDGEPRIQIRLDLGLLQMHAEGRPDGQRPYGFPSLLDYYDSLRDREELTDLAADEESEEAASETLTINVEDSRALREELAQYNQRALALLALEDFECVVRDSSRNLRVLDLCKSAAEQEDDRTVLEQYRPYILMMRYRALASQAVKDNEAKAALLVIDEGLAALKVCYGDMGKPNLYEASTEVQMLRGIRDQLVPKLPLSQKAELKRRLGEAIEQENYELAAILRDELKQLKD